MDPMLDSFKVASGFSDSSEQSTMRSIRSHLISLEEV